MAESTANDAAVGSTTPQPSTTTPQPSTTTAQFILGAIEAEAVAKRSKAVANFNIYMQSATGIGEHPDIVAECAKLVQDIADADGTIETLRRIVS